MAAPSRIDHALRWLSEEISATPDEFRNAHREGSAMLLDGLVSQGYALSNGERVAVSDRGRRRLADTLPDPVEA